MTWFFWAVAIWNVIVFVMYGVDKHRAEKHEWRIRESVLLGGAFALGAVGAFLGMRIFHHKTLHKKFKIGVPIALVVNIAAVYLILTNI